MLVLVRRFCLVVFGSSHRKLSYWRTLRASRKIERMHGRSREPSPGPWTFSEHMYGIAHCLIPGALRGCSSGSLTGRARVPGEDDE
jgi:hypothetical protein